MMVFHSVAAAFSYSMVSEELVYSTNKAILSIKILIAWCTNVELAADLAVPVEKEM